MDQPFVHLHVHTEYSLLDGAARIESLVEQAAKLGMPALAITDHGVMYGVVDFYKQAKKNGVKPIIGCEVYVAPRGRFDRDPQKDSEQHHLVLLAQNEIGYRNLVRLVSQASTEGFYYKPRVDHQLLQQHNEGLICLSACLAGEIPSLIARDQFEQARGRAEFYRGLFPGRYYLELQDHGFEEQRKVNSKLLQLSKQLDIPLVATNDVHYINRKDSYIQDVLMCIQMGKNLEDAGRMRFEGEEFYLKNRREMESLFGEHREALDNTLLIAEQCNLDFQFGVNHLPEFPIPIDPEFELWQRENANPLPGVPWSSTERYLYFLCHKGMKQRGFAHNNLYWQRLDFEFQTICRMGFAGYFLIVQDFCAFARSREILVGPGRGSAAGSLVSYVLGITDIDPIKYDLLFERFLNPERVSMPDIDIDFDFVRRVEVINYVLEKYGPERVAQIITFGTMAARAAVRDVGRALNFPLSTVDKVAKAIPAELNMTIERALEISPDLKTLCEDQRINHLVETAKAIEGMPRHASTHAAGVVIAPSPLVDYLPVQRGSEEAVVTQFPKDTVEEIGLLKMDLLGLKTLTLVGDVLKHIEKSRGIKLKAEDFPLDDPAAYELLSRGDSLGVFQLESSGLRTILKELKPNSFEDVVALVALYRPGPLGSGMVEDFIGRKHGQRTVEFLHPLLEPILQDTYGVILYQEQVMRIASDLAGFTLGQADLLRRAMGKKKPEVIAGLRKEFVDGATAREVTPKVAGEIFDLMEYFAGYGFNKSHSAAYALIAFQTAYLKANYSVEFMAGLLTSVADSSDKVSQYIEESRRMNIRVLPPDVNASSVDFTVIPEQQQIRFGLAAVKNVGRGAIDAIINAREATGPFRSLEDFCLRVDGRQVNRRVLESLIKSGSMSSLGQRRPLLQILDRCLDVAQSKQRDQAAGQMNLFDCHEGDGDLQDSIPVPQVAEFAHRDLLSMEKELLGFYFSGHPLEELRSVIRKRVDLTTAELSKDWEQRRIALGGMITALRRTVTKKGAAMAYFTLEDWGGSIEVLVFPKTYMRIGSLLQDDRPVIVEGRVHYEEENRKFFLENLTLLDTQEVGNELAAGLAEQSAAKDEREFNDMDKAPGGELHLKMRASSKDESVTNALLKVLRRYPGKEHVFLYFLEDRRAYRTDPEHWVSICKELEDELSYLFGPGCCQFR